MLMLSKPKSTENVPVVEQVVFITSCSKGELISWGIMGSLSKRILEGLRRKVFTLDRVMSEIRGITINLIYREGRFTTRIKLQLVKK